MSLEAFKMYCVMRASVPSLYNVYRRYDTTKQCCSMHKMCEMTPLLLLMLMHNAARRMWSPDKALLCFSITSSFSSIYTRNSALVSTCLTRSKRAQNKLRAIYIAWQQSKHNKDIEYHINYRTPSLGHACIARTA